jgi:hypothetical protein
MKARIIAERGYKKGDRSIFGDGKWDRSIFHIGK